MTKVGYARVSTNGKNLDVQLLKLEGYGCDEIFRINIQVLPQIALS